MTWQDIAPILIGPSGRLGGITTEVAGSKAAQLAQMMRLGLNVPPAFVVPTTFCGPVNANEPKALEGLRQGLQKGIAWLEQVTGRRFGDIRNPLLVSVRSGAPQSMPGMLQTILNLGLNGETVHGFIRAAGNPRLVWDSYRRFIQAYAEVVEGVSGADFGQRLTDMLKREGIVDTAALDPEALERLTAEFREIAERLSGRPLPADPFEQLFAAARAVYRSWEGPRAREYRRLNKLDELAGTAVTVQMMVFGNCGGNSGAGVAFSRNPATGANELYVDFLFDAQGEDVVSGRRTPSNAARLAARLPQAAKQLEEGARRLDYEFHDAQDIEFTIENGKLYFLQTRTAKRTPRAALHIAVELVHEGAIDTQEALARLADIDLGHLGITRFAEPAQPIARAIPASSGVASGRVAFDCTRAKKFVDGGEPAILVRPETSTEDIEGYAVADGILTATGGRTAHAAVVARQLGKACLVGCQSLSFDEQYRDVMIGNERICEGDWLSLDGDTGEITLGKRIIVAERPPELDELEHWHRVWSAE